MAESLKSDSTTQKDWWKLIKYFISPTEKQSIPPLKNPINDELVFDSKLKSDLLNDFFCSQSSLNNSDKELPFNDCNMPTNILCSISITPQEFEDALRSLKTNKASGPDGVSNRILRETASVIKFPLCSLFNQSLQTCKIPFTWKKANVCAVFKKGDPSVPNKTKVFFLS
jgi:hypothetical protein